MDKTLYVGGDATVGAISQSSEACCSATQARLSLSLEGGAVITGDITADELIAGNETPASRPPPALCVSREASVPRGDPGSAAQLRPRRVSVLDDTDSDSTATGFNGLGDSASRRL